MARIATITKKEELGPQGQRVFDAIAQSRGAVGGPWLALLHSPEMAERTMRLGSYVRFESTLDHKVIEFTALVTARELDCKHEWAAHINHASKAGIPAATVRLVHAKQGPESFSSEDAQIVSLVREMIHTHRVSEPTFQAIYARFGEQGMVELTATIGYYAMLACTLNTFDVHTFTPPDDLKI